MGIHRLPVFLLCYSILFLCQNLWRGARGGQEIPSAHNSWVLGYVLHLDTNVGSFYTALLQYVLCASQILEWDLHPSSALHPSRTSHRKALCQRALGPLHFLPLTDGYEAARHQKRERENLKSNGRFSGKSWKRSSFANQIDPTLSVFKASVYFSYSLMSDDNTYIQITETFSWICPVWMIENLHGHI